jgi:S-formylglutathione hydrolase
MFSYISQELTQLVENYFWVSSKKSIMGHSMGGHGALLLGLKTK